MLCRATLIHFSSPMIWSEYVHPSILTEVYQVRCRFFSNSTCYMLSVRDLCPLPVGGMGGIKRAAEGSKEEPSGKKNQPVAAKTFASVPATENQPPSTPEISVTKPQRPSPKLPRVPDQVRTWPSSSATRVHMNQRQKRIYFL